MPGLKISAASAAIALSIGCLLSACAGGGPSGTGRRELQGAAPTSHQALPVQQALSGKPYDLPAPATPSLGQTAPRAGSYVQADLLREAEDFEAALLKQNVSATANGLSFTPSFVAASSTSPAGLAFALFNFSAPGYDQNAELHLLWNSAPSEQESTYVGLANWALRRYDWFPLQASSAIFPPSMAPYFDPLGNLQAVVLRTGTEPSELDALRLGPLLPQARLSAIGPRFAYLELFSTLDASASSDANGSIVKYEWDYDGDGVFDEETGVTATVDHHYTQAGTFNAAVRVSNEFGGHDVARLKVSVGGPWIHTIGYPSTEQGSDIAAAPDGTLWTCSTIRHNGDSTEQSDLYLLHYDASGALLLEQAWHPTSASLGIAGMSFPRITCAEDGSFYLVFQANGNSTQYTFVQGYDPDGVLLWSRGFNEGTFNSTCIEVHGDDLFVAGTVPGNPSPHATLVKLTTAGTFVGAVSLGPASNFKALRYASAEDSANDALEVCGRIGSPNTDVLYSRFSPNLALISASTWGAASDSEEGRCIALGGSPQAPKVFIGAILLSGANIGDCAVLDSALDAGMAVRTMGSGGFSPPLDLQVLSSGSLLLFTNNSSFPEFSTGVFEVITITPELTLGDTASFAPLVETGAAHVRAYANDAFIVTGAAPFAAGNFTAGGGLFGSFTHSWTSTSPATAVPALTTKDTGLESDAEPPPGTQDTGAGSEDILTLMNRFESM